MRAILHFWLVFLLLFTQGGALVHGVSHLAKPAQYRSLQDQQPVHLAACDACLAYAGSANAAPAGRPHIHTPAFVPGHTAAPVAAARSTSFQPYLSRAPPALA